MELPNPKKFAFNFETKKVLLNSGYEMPIHGLGTYSLHKEACQKAVKNALANSIYLIDTAHRYGNEIEIGQAIREALKELDLKREEIFVTTKIYPGSDMKNPEKAIQACLDRLNNWICRSYAIASSRSQRCKSVFSYGKICKMKEKYAL